METIWSKYRPIGYQKGLLFMKGKLLEGMDTRYIYKIQETPESLNLELKASFKMDSKLARYKELLNQIQKYLERYSETEWSNRLTEWINQLNSLTDSESKKHLIRTLKGLSGMGSIGDILLCPENGHSISSDKAEIDSANNILKKFVSDLYNEIEKLL